MRPCRTRKGPRPVHKPNLLFSSTSRLLFSTSSQRSPRGKAFGGVSAPRPRGDLRAPHEQGPFQPSTPLKPPNLQTFRVWKGAVPRARTQPRRARTGPGRRARGAQARGAQARRRAGARREEGASALGLTVVLALGEPVLHEAAHLSGPLRLLDVWSGDCRTDTTAQEGAELFSWPWETHVEPLQSVTTLGLQKGHVRRAFHAFRDDLQPQVVA